jgi:hypothetical protein
MNFISPMFNNEVEKKEFENFCSQAPSKDLVRSVLGSYVIEAGFWQRLRIMLGRNKAEITGPLLVIANLAVIEEDRALARKQQQLDILHAAIIKAWPQDLNKSDYSNHSRVDELCKDPNFSAAKFLDDLFWHPENWSWVSGKKELDLVSMVRTANRQRLAEIVAHVGEVRVQQALKEIQNRMHGHKPGDTIQGSQPYAKVERVEDETGGGHRYKGISQEQVAADAADAQTRATTAKEAKAQAESESLAQRAVSSSNHASTQRLREALANTWGSTWVETLEKRQQLYRNWRG